MTTGLLTSIGGVQIDDRQFKLRIAQAPRVMFSAIKDGVERGLAGFRKEWVPRVLSARLRRATRWLFVAYARGTNLKTLEVRMHPRKFHQSLAALDEGLRMKPPSGEYFAIPVGRVRKRGGKGRPKAGYARPAAFRARFPNRRLVLSKDGRTLIEVRRRGGKKSGHDETVGPAFALRRSVLIPPILNYRKTWSRTETQKRFRERVLKTLERELKKTFGSKSVNRGGSR